MSKITMFVYNSFTHDARVLREATTLKDNGYDVWVLAVLDEQTKAYEKINNISVVRFPKNPLHLNVIKKLKGAGSIKNALFQISTIKSKGVHNYLSDILHKKEKRLINSLSLITSLLLILVVSPLLLVLLFLYYCLRLMHKPLCFFDFYVRCYKYLKTNPSGIYHAHDLNTLPIAFFVSRIHNSVLVYDSHELYVERNTRRQSKIGKFILKLAEGYFVKRTNAIITVNKSIANEISNRYKVKTPYVVMNCPSEKKGSTAYEQKSLRKILNVKQDKKLLLYCGSITFNRGLEKLIESMKYLEDCHLVFMGYGKQEYKAKLSKYVENNNIDDRFDFFGPVPSHEVTAYAASADLGVAPIENACLSYYYCSPNKVFEYINAGIPVIASSFPELKFVVENYGIGLTFDVVNPKSIAEAARRILDNKELYEQMKEGTKQASTYFNWENESKTLINLYKELSV